MARSLGNQARSVITEAARAGRISRAAAGQARDAGRRCDGRCPGHAPSSMAFKLATRRPSLLKSRKLRDLDLPCACSEVRAVLTSTKAWRRSSSGMSSGPIRTRLGERLEQVARARCPRLSRARRPHRASFSNASRASAMPAPAFRKRGEMKKPSGNYAARLSRLGAG